jgi:hypothetical protein
MAEVIGETSEFIEGSREVCRAMECPMGNLVADAMLDRVRDQGIDVAIQNGGGLRASIDGGPITMGEVLTVLPFQNTLATFQLTGAQIVEALENGVSQVEDGAGRFPQVAGMRYTWDAGAEPGSRIVSSRSRVRTAALPPSTPKRPTAWCPTTTCAPAATDMPFSRPTARTPMITARAWSKWSPTTSAPTPPTGPTPTGGFPRSNKAHAKSPGETRPVRKNAPAFFMGRCRIAENAKRVSKSVSCGWR